MHITLETDYAIRIVDCLAKNPGRLGAQEIAQRTQVTLRFSLKILRKLVANGILRSYKGAQGGYEIALPLEQVSLGAIIETIEGPFMLNRCLQSCHACTRVPDKRCPYHRAFAEISGEVRQKLKSMTLDKLLADNV